MVEENKQSTAIIEKKEEITTDLKIEQKNPEVKTEPIKPELPKPKPQQQYLNIRMDFPKTTVDERKKRLEKVIAMLKMYTSTFMRFESDSDSFCLTYQMPSDIGLNRRFKPFNRLGIKINATISDEALYDVIQIPMQIKIIGKDGNEVAAYVSAPELVKNLEILAGEVTYDKSNYSRFAKFVIENRNLIKNEKFPDRIEWHLELDNLFAESDVKEILNNFEQFYSCLEELFHVLDSNNNLILFDKLPLPDTLDCQNIDEMNNKLVLFRGFLKQKEFEPIEGKMRTVLTMRAQSNSIRSQFRVFILHNDNYYNSHLDQVLINTGIQVLGIINIDEKHNYTIKAFTIKETSEKTLIRSWSMLKQKANYFFENDFREPTPGMHVRAYKEDNENITYSKRFSYSPLEVLQTLETDEGENLFNIRMGKDEFFGNFDTIIESLRKNPTMLETGDEVKNCVHNIMNFMIKEQQLKPKKAYTVTGIHLDENKNLILVVPPQYKIIPRNGKSENALKQINMAKYFTGEATEEETVRKLVVKLYYDLFDYKGQAFEIRTGVGGFSAIGNFLKVLSKDRSIDVFPLTGMVGVGGAGKTQYMRLYTESFNGIELVNGSDLKNSSRLRDYLGMTTLVFLVDDIQKMDGEVVSDLKSALTSFKNFGYKERNQHWVNVPVTGSFFFSSNNMAWLNDDLAFRDGRVILYRTFARIEDQDATNEFERIRNGINAHPLIGFYFLRFCLKYLKETRESLGDGSKVDSDFECLLYLVERNRKYVKEVYSNNKIRSTDTRRFTINAMILTGLQFWKAFFLSEIGKIPDLLTKILDPFQPDFANFLKNSESQGWESRLEEIMQIRTFIQLQYKDQQCAKTTDRQIFRIGDESIFYLTTGFLAKYNEWAKRCEFPTYETQPLLCDMLNKVANPPILPKPKTFAIWDEGNELTVQDRVVMFDVEKLLGEKLLPVSKSNQTDTQKQKIHNLFEKVKTFPKKFDFQSLIEILSPIDMITEEFAKTMLKNWVNDGTLKEEKGMYELIGKKKPKN
jgi:hypothetical protein